MLSMVDFQNPLLWALLIGWIMSVVLHEFGHGVVAYWGGDYTIKQRGGLTLNPLQYVDPMLSIVMPIAFLLMGGIPLAGGVTYVRRDLLRTPLWRSAVSAAGPFMNVLIFLALCAALHPKVGWVPAHVSAHSWTKAQVFVGAMAFLQLFAVFINLIPIPGVDGFGIISPWLPPEINARVAIPQVRMACFVGFYLLLSIDAVGYGLIRGVLGVIDALGVNGFECWRAFSLCR